MSVSDELLAEVDPLKEIASRVQDETQTPESRQDVLNQLNQRYHDWYRRGLSFLTSVGDIDVKQKFEQEYEGGLFSQKILSFLTDGLRVSPFYKPEQENPFFPKFAYKVQDTFHQPLVKQSNYIAVAARSTIKADSVGEGWNSTVRRIFQAFIDKAEVAKTNQEKKFAYEYLAIFIIGSIEGLNILGHDERGSADEIDLWVANQSSVPFFQKHLGDPFIVECKNWGEAVSAKEIRSIRSIMDDKHIRFALVLARNGVTGADAKDAQEIIRRAFLEEKYMCPTGEPRGG